MIGWHISVYRQADGGSSPATEQSLRGQRLAVWQTALNGCNWLNELVEESKAVDLGGNGYPNQYTATAEHLVPKLFAGPPLANSIWDSDEGDIVGEAWEGRTVVDAEEVRQCRFDEWLIVEAWDES
jgi:hypothetical protein